MDYDSYGDWYDNGPGSENFARECRESMNSGMEEKFNFLENWLKNTEGPYEKVMMDMRKAIRDRFMDRTIKYKAAWSALEAVDKLEIEPIEDELFEI